MRDRITVNGLLVWLILTAVCGAGSIPAALAAESMPLVRVRLVTDANSITPGKKFRLGALFEIPEGCHIYWQNPGDAGLATAVDWKLPRGFHAGPLFWPVPERIEEPGGLIVNVYRNQVLLFCWVQPPDTAGAGQAELAASASWLVCKKVCIQESAEPGLVLPLGPGNAKPQSEAALFSRYEKEVPRPAVDYPGLALYASWSTGESAGDGSRMGVIEIGKTGSGALFLPPVRKFQWFDEPSENLFSEDFHESTADSEPGRLVFHLLIHRLDASQSWPESWGGVMVLGQAGADTATYNLEVRFED
jgi:hypothetical protein